MLKQTEISIIEFEKILEKDRVALLYGNGFSMNFDSSYTNIYNNLYNSHKELIRNSNYELNATNLMFKDKFIENFKAVKQHLRDYSEKNLKEMFNDALIFAKGINQNLKLIERIKESDFLTNTTIEISELSLLNEICKKDKFEDVNIEYWTILIYFYNVVKILNAEAIPKCNRFITVLEIGAINKNIIAGGDLKKDKKTYVINETIFNGFNTYYRFLFSIAIFNNGKYLNLNSLDKIKNLDLPKIKKFLQKFKGIMTTNYDTIGELILDTEDIKHLHGKFLMNERQYIHNQLLEMQCVGGYVNFSNILIGDYMWNKTYRAIVNDLCSKKFGWEYKHNNTLIEEVIGENKINTVFIFGLNIQNDQHIIREIMAKMYFDNIENPKIIYSYFSIEDKESFTEEFSKLITFSHELNKYCNNIEVQMINAKKILDIYFNKI